MQKINTIYGFSNHSGAHNQYREQSIMTASPADLVTMLYDGAIKNIKFTKIAIQDGNIELKNKYGQKAQEIIDELMKGLDFSYEMSYDLLKLYDFIIQQLIDANIERDVSKLDIAHDMLVEMKETWTEAIKISRSAPKVASR